MKILKEGTIKIGVHGAFVMTGFEVQMEPTDVDGGYQALADIGVARLDAAIAHHQAGSKGFLITENTLRGDPVDIGGNTFRGGGGIRVP